MRKLILHIIEFFEYIIAKWKPLALWKKIALILIGLYLIGISNKHTNYNTDGTVYCVVHYLKQGYLRDPDSYEGISWGEVMKSSNGNYVVTHTFRAKNGFGGLNVQTMTFTFTPDGSRVISAY